MDLSFQGGSLNAEPSCVLLVTNSSSPEAVRRCPPGMARNCLHSGGGGGFQSTAILSVSIPKVIKPPSSPAEGSSSAYLGQQRLPILQPAVRGLRSPACSAFPDDAFLYGCVSIADFLNPVGLSCNAEVKNKALCL